MSNDLEEGGVIDQVFTYDIELFDRKIKVSLTEPGEKLGLVTDENKKLYVKRLLYSKLVKGIEPQVNVFKEGFYKFVKLEHLSTFSSDDLDILIGGIPLSCEDLQQTTKYSDDDLSSSEVIQWFWEIVSGFDYEGLSALLYFATGKGPLGARHS